MFSWPIVLDAIFSTTFVLILITLLIFLYVVYLRIRNKIIEHNTRIFKTKWRRIIFNWMVGEKTGYINLRSRDQIRLIDTWHGIRRILEDGSAEELNDFAVTFKLDEIVARILQYRTYSSENKKVWLQLLAVRVARYMHTNTAVEALLRANNSSNFRVNIAATCALVELKHELADLSVLSSILKFQQWTPYIITKVSISGGSSLLHLIGAQLSDMGAERSNNLISLANATFDRSLLPLLINILRSQQDMQEQASILRTIGRIGDNSHIKEIIPFLSSKDPVLRLRAVVALGNLGDKSALRSILRLTSDENWWVRYRAVESYLNISKPDDALFGQLLDTISDDDAKKMFKHVFTELKYA